MYSPGSENVAVVAALPFTSFACAALNVTSPGPRYFAQSTVMPAGCPRRIGSPSSVADTVSVVVPRGAATDAVAGCSSTDGGVFELMRSLLPPRVARIRSICHTGLSVPATRSVCP